MVGGGGCVQGLLLAGERVEQERETAHLQELLDPLDGLTTWGAGRRWC